MKQKRFMSLLLTLCMLFTLAPMSVFADETTPSTPTPTSVTVSFTSQAANAFLHAPQMNVEVSSDLAENYGYTDDVDGVSALDVLVKAHQLVFEDAFTIENKVTMLKVENGSIETIFGAETSNCRFAVNGKTPHDDVLIKSAYGDYYTGYTVNSAKIKDNDFLKFFLYQNILAVRMPIMFQF